MLPSPNSRRTGCVITQIKACAELRFLFLYNGHTFLISLHRLLHTYFTPSGNPYDTRPPWRPEHEAHPRRTGTAPAEKRQGTIAPAFPVGPEIAGSSRWRCHRHPVEHHH